MSDLASDFYSGLIAQLYEPLAGSLPAPDRFARFVEKNGTPALELACGAGNPMLELIARGLEVWGIDSSQDMLNQCLERAEKRGLSANVEHQLMQELDLSQRFSSCYIAGASFCLMDQLGDAQETLDRVYRHLVPTGTFLLSVFRPALVAQPGAETAKTRQDGSRISVQSVAQREIDGEQIVVTRLLYSVRVSETIEETVERDWKIRWYEKRQLCPMLESAGFEITSAKDFDGKDSEPASCNFSIIAKKPGE